jgi:cholesterol transport system auxiliary component
VMRTWISISVVPIVCLLHSGCIGGRPIHYYAINAPAAPAAEAKPNGPALLVGRITTPEALEDGRIRYRSGNNEVGSYEYHRWTERPALMVRDLLIESLRASGQYRLVQEASSSGAGDYLVRGKLTEFCEIDGPSIQTRVALEVELVDRKSALVVWNHVYKRDEPVDGKAMKDVVGSLDRNVQRTVADVSSGIGGFLANKP